jgi:hypothetical protein
MVRFGGIGGFFAYCAVQVRKCRPIPRFFTPLQTLMPEFDQPPFTSTEPNSPDDGFLKLRVFGSLTRGEYCRCALRFMAGGAAKTEVGVEAAGSIREEGISRREVSVEP